MDSNERIVGAQEQQSVAWRQAEEQATGQQVQGQQTVAMQQTAGQAQQQVAGQAQQQVAWQQAASQNVAPQPEPVRKKTNIEYLIATILMSVVGGGFLLTALVLFGMNFLNDWVMSLALFAGSLAVLLVAEIILSRKWPRLGQTLSAIAIAALYLSTLVTYLSLHLMSMEVAAGIVIVTTFAAVILGRERDSLMHRLLGIVACSLCIYPMSDLTLTNGEVLVVFLVYFVMNAFCICIPVRKHRIGVGIFHLYVNAITMPWMLGFLVDREGYPYPLIAVGVLVFIVLQQWIFLCQCRVRRKRMNQGERVGKAGSIAAYLIHSLVTCVCATCYLLATYTYVSDEIELDAAMMVVSLAFPLFCAAALAVVVLVLTLLNMLLLRKCEEKWILWYLAAFFIPLMFAVMDMQVGFAYVVALTVTMLLMKLLSFAAGRSLYGLDIVLTSLSCILLFVFQDDLLSSYVLLAGLLVSVFLVHGPKTYLELILSFALAIYAWVQLPTVLGLPAFAGILFVCVLLFNNLPYARGKGIKGYNWTVFAGEVIAYVYLAAPIYRGLYLTYFCMAVFGLAYVVLTSQNKYYFDMKHRSILYAVFLTYMALILRANASIVNSILLMVVALVCVCIGFLCKELVTRIYGLILSLLVCAKIVLYDYFDIPVLQKTILFFVVGIVALAIAAIYMILEKKTQGKREAQPLQTARAQGDVLVKQSTADEGNAAVGYGVPEAREAVTNQKTVVGEDSATGMITPEESTAAQGQEREQCLSAQESPLAEQSIPTGQEELGDETNG